MTPCLVRGRGIHLGAAPHRGRRALLSTGGIAFRDLGLHYLLPMAGLIAYTPLKQEEEPSPRVECLGVRLAFRHTPTSF